MRNLRSDLDVPSGATIGLEMDVLPCNFYFRVSGALKESKFVDVSETIRHIRSVKSNFEIGLIREAARILEDGFASIPDYLEEGMTRGGFDWCPLGIVYWRSIGDIKVPLRLPPSFNSHRPLGHVMSAGCCSQPFAYPDRYGKDDIGRQMLGDGSIEQDPGLRRKFLVTTPVQGRHRDSWRYRKDMGGIGEGRGEGLAAVGIGV